MATKSDQFGRYLPPSDSQFPTVIRPRLSGNRVAAGALLQNVLKSVVPNFIQFGKFQNLQQFQKVIEYPTGEVVRLRSVFGTIMVDVHVPVVPVVVPAGRKEPPVLEKEVSYWEPWDGSNSNMCVDHTWRVGMTDPFGYRHDWAYCDGSFVLDPPVYDTPPSPLGGDKRCDPVTVTDLYWLDLSGGALKCDMRKTNAGIYGTTCVSYRSAYVEWQAGLDTVRPTAHQGKENIEFAIDCWYTGTFDDDQQDTLPNTSFVSVELTDVDSNFVRLYFKADAPYLTLIGETAYLIGDGVVRVNLPTWGLTADIDKILIVAYNDFLYDDNGGDEDWDRLVSYRCDYIDFY